MKIKIAMTLLTSCGLIGDCLCMKEQSHQQTTNELKIDIEKICIPECTQEVRDFISAESEKKTISLEKIFPRIKTLAEYVEGEFNKQFINTIRNKLTPQHQQNLETGSNNVNCQFINISGKVYIKYPTQGNIIHALLGHDNSFTGGYIYIYR